MLIKEVKVVINLHRGYFWGWLSLIWSRSRSWLWMRSSVLFDLRNRFWFWKRSGPLLFIVWIERRWVMSHYHRMACLGSQLIIKGIVECHVIRRGGIRTMVDTMGRFRSHLLYSSGYWDQCHFLIRGFSSVRVVVNELAFLLFIFQKSFDHFLLRRREFTDDRFVWSRLLPFNRFDTHVSFNCCIF